MGVGCSKKKGLELTVPLVLWSLSFSYRLDILGTQLMYVSNGDDDDYSIKVGSLRLSHIFFHPIFLFLYISGCKKREGRVGRVRTDQTDRGHRGHRGYEGV